MSGRRAQSVAERRERRTAVTDPEVVLEAAAAFLAVRARSVAETRRRLRHLGYNEPLVDGVVARLVEMRYLDDEAFARAWVESRDRARPRGAAALRRELSLKGIDREIIHDILRERADDGVVPPDVDPETAHVSATPDRVAAERLLARRRYTLEREPDPRKRRQRAYALLARNGFDPSTINDAIRTALEDDDEPEPDR